MTHDLDQAWQERRELDLLVDGALPDHRRRALLQQLDQQSDGWRRLALAFLEAQCFGEVARAPADRSEDLAPIASHSVPVPANAPAAASPAQSRTVRTWSSRLAAPLAMAASFLLAFTLGLILRGSWFVQPESSQPAVAKSAVPAATEVAVADAEQTPTTLVVGPDSLSSDGFNEVWLASDEATDESLLSGEPTQVVPEQVLRSLRRTGHQVETHRSLWPVNLQNGRRALVPVDEVEIRYIGNEYQ